MWLLDGHPIGAESPHDVAALVGRLEARGALPAPEAEALRALDPVEGLATLASRVAARTLDPLLRDRWAENLSQFVGHRGTPSWSEGGAPWCLNVQVDRAPRRTLDEALARWQAATSLPDDTLLIAGPATPTTPDHHEVVAALAEGPTPIVDLATALPLEPLAARAALASMLERGVVAEADPAGPSSPVDDDDDHPADDLEAFAGGDGSRGGGRDGSFVQDKRTLDRVEVVDVAEEPAPGRAEPTYAAPTLAESDALEKIAVANHVLQAVSGAFDRDLGHGRGVATVQLLLDGRPRAYVPLFEGLRAQAGGRLPSEALLHNLRQRPEPEQRRLLNQGLLDLMDRALDRAAEELEDATLDAVLEKVVGYRQRIGL